MGRPSIALTASSAAYIVAGFFLTILLARMLGPGGFGAYTVVAALLTVVNLVVGRGVPVAASRTIARDPSGLLATMRSAIRASAALAALVGLVVLLLAVPASRLLGAELRVPLLLGAAAAVTFTVQALAVAPLNGLLRFGLQAVTRFTYAGSRLVLITLGAWLAGLPGAIVGFVLAPLVASLPALALLGTRPPTSDTGLPPTAGARPARRATSRDLLRQAVPLLLTATWVSLLLSVDLIAFRAVGSAASTGHYGAAGTLGHVPFFLLAMLPTEILPRVAAAADDAARRALAGRLLDDAAVMLAAPTVAIIAGAPVLVAPIFGRDYAPAVELVAPLAIATVAVSMHAMLTAVDGAISRLRVAVTLGASGTGAMALAVALAGREHGAVGAAWSAAAVATALALLHWGLTVAAGRARRPGAASLAGLAAVGAAAALPVSGIGPVGKLAVGAALAVALALLAVRRFRGGDRVRQSPAPASPAGT